MNTRIQTLSYKLEVKTLRSPFYTLVLLNLVPSLVKLVCSYSHTFPYGYDTLNTLSKSYNWYSCACGLFYVPPYMSTPTHIKDAVHIVKTYEACQKTSVHQSSPSRLAQLIAPTWPLQRWGMDLINPLPPSQWGNKFVVVAIEYFTRWIEARPLTNYNLYHGQKVLLAKHSLQIWCTQDPNHHQMEKLWLRPIQIVLPKHRNNTRLRLCLPPRIQWSSRKSQQSSVLCNIKNTIQPSQGQMGWRPT